MLNRLLFILFTVVCIYCKVIFIVCLKCFGAASLEKATLFKALSMKMYNICSLSTQSAVFTVKLIDEALSSVFVDGDICNKRTIRKKICRKIFFQSVITSCSTAYLPKYLISQSHS